MIQHLWRNLRLIDVIARWSHQQSLMVLSRCGILVSSVKYTFSSLAFELVNLTWKKLILLKWRGTFCLNWSKVSKIFVTKCSCWDLLSISPSINPLSWTPMRMIPPSSLLINPFATGNMWWRDWVCFALMDSCSIKKDLCPLYSTSLPSLVVNWSCHL